MIQITATLYLDESEIQFDFVRASGPGGQNVNKVSSVAQLRFDVAHSPSLPEDVRKRLLRLAARRINKDGVLLIDARSARSQERNRQEALERLVQLIRQAALKPKVRRKTRPTRASQERRLQRKQQQGEKKRRRRSPTHNDE